MAAAWDGHADTVRLLLDKGADPNVIGKDGSTALSLAQKLKHTAVMEMLRAAGAKK